MSNRKTKENTSQDLILIDLQKWTGRIISHWWLFLLGLLLAYGAAKLYLRYTTYQYSARAILLIKDAGRSGVISEQNILVAEQASLSGNKAMDNEIQILKSLTLMEKVVQRLNLETKYYRQGNIKESELYLESPFLLESYLLTKALETSLTFYIELDGYDSFVLKDRKDDEEGRRIPFGLTFQNEHGQFKISYNSVVAILPGMYRLTIVPVETAAAAYSSRLKVQRIGDQFASSVLELSILDPVPAKAKDILNTLIDVYNEEEIKDENKVLRNTLDFIDQRVADLLIELDSIEGGVEDFKSANSIITESASASLNFTLNEIRTAVQQMSQYEIQRDILRSLENFLINEKSAFELIPTNLIAENPVLSGLVNQYNGLILQRNAILTTASEINPARVTLEEQIVDIRALILETIQNSQDDLQIPIGKLEQNIQDLRRSMTTIPGVEKRLVEQMRTQSIKENLFLYLLQKREQTALSEAITTAKTRTVDPARASKGPVYPKKQLVMAASMVLGLMLPLIFLIVRSFFEVTVHSEDTIRELTSIPLLGRIAQADKPESIVVRAGSRTAIDEMFRLLRTNLSFVNLDKDQQTIMVTSSVSEEGKTFVVLNLGLTLAMADKKVVLLGMDMRKPKLGRSLGLTSAEKGLSTYLIGQAGIDDILHTYEEHPNLSFIPSGPIPPNPTELLMNKRVEILLSDLRQQFDYILIDTPPINLVSDALLLRPYVSDILIIIRHAYTRKTMLKDVEEMYQNGELEGAHLVYNGIKYQRGYGRHYYQDYGRSYYIDEKSTK